MDDIPIASKSQKDVDTIKKLLNSKYGVKDLGPMSRFLSYHVRRDREKKTITLSQEHYVGKILEQAHMSFCAPSKSKGELFQKGLLLSDCPTSIEDQQMMKAIPYRELVGSLQQLATHTRPDICYEVSTLSRFLKNPGINHWTALKQLLKYLKYTSAVSLTLGGTNDMTLQGYVDATYNKCPETGRSTGGYVILIDKSAVSWKASWFKHSYPSSTESEFAALYMATTQAVWLRKLLLSLGYS